MMVKSGLKDEIIINNQVPRVDHFWLSAHLASAFVIYSTMVATGLEILQRNKPVIKVPHSFNTLDTDDWRATKIRTYCARV
jgi:heme A synthase